MSTSGGAPIEPVHLIEDAETGDRFLIYGTDKGIRVELRYEGDALWMTQAQISELFGIDRSVVGRHLRNIFEEGELEEGSVCAKYARTADDGKTYQTQHYNLDAVISVGYRVNSKHGTIFRKWATEKLVQFATRGFVIDVERLKDPEDIDRISELREIIRDIRSDEKNVYRELRRICSMCQDYNGDSPAWREFYQRTQARLMWAVTSQTPSEIVYRRADSSIENMGLQTWPKSEIRKSDTEVSKNYLSPREIRELNRLTTILLDIFEDQLDLGRLVIMGDAERLLERQLTQLGRQVLRSGGSISSSMAKERAHAEYKNFDDNRRAIRQKEAEDNLTRLKANTKNLSNRRRTR